MLFSYCPPVLFFGWSWLFRRVLFAPVDARLAARPTRFSLFSYVEENADIILLTAREFVLATGALALFFYSRAVYMFYSRGARVYMYVVLPFPS
jgi:hypothetical protein